MAFLGSQETKNAVSIANGIEKNLEKERWKTKGRGATYDNELKELMKLNWASGLCTIVILIGHSNGIIQKDKKARKYKKTTA